MLWGITIFLVLIILVLIFIITNLLNQISILEREVKKTQRVVDSVNNIYDFFLRLFTKTLSDMETIDRRGAFKSDDEVGFIFNVLLESIKHVKFQIEKLKLPLPEDEDENEKRD